MPSSKEKSLAVFLPARKGSERIKNKNTKPFGGISSGLIGIKLKQLSLLDGVTVYLSTNDEACMMVAESFVEEGMNLKIITRPEHLCTSSTALKDLIAYVPEIINEKHILWTHSTSPFVTEKVYVKAIDAYFEAHEHDSLMSVTRIQEFLWSAKQHGFINFARKPGEWPRTQDLEPLYAVNSGIFIAPRTVYVEGDRIGVNPALFELSPKAAIDVDWEEDFEFAETIFRNEQ